MREPRAVGWMKYFDGRIAFEKYSAFIPDDALSLGWRKLYTDDALQAAAVEAQNQQARIAELETELAQVSGYLETMTERCVTETQRNAELEQQLAELREALTRIRDCDWVITLPDRMDAVREIAREALDQSQEQTP